MSGPRQVLVNRLSDFLGHIENEKELEESHGNNSDFIFRGQQIDKPLLPRLARVVPKGERLHIERLMFDEFKRIGFALSDLKPETPWDFLAIAQHHRLPTRLLDWTYSALAAMWFSVEKPPKRVNGKSLNAVVWLLKTRVSDFVEESSGESPFKFEKSGTRIYRPRVITPRIAAQGGIFTVHRMLKSEGFVALESNARFSERLVKFTIPPPGFSDIRKHLHGCGVNNFSLFPDLDGLCRHLEWRYTKLAPDSDLLTPAVK